MSLVVTLFTGKFNKFYFYIKWKNNNENTAWILMEFIFIWSLFKAIYYKSPVISNNNNNNKENNDFFYVEGS